MKTVTIRLAENHDFEAIYSIWRQGLNNSFLTDTVSETELYNKFNSNFARRNGIFNFWVATGPANELLGWQSLLPFSVNPFRSDCYAESSTYIALKNQYSGLGKELLKYAISEAQKAGLEFIVGFVSSYNRPALQLVRMLGFTEVGEFPSNLKKDNGNKILFVLQIS